MRNTTELVKSLIIEREKTAKLSLVRKKKYLTNARTLERLAGGNLEAALKDEKKLRALIDKIDNSQYQAWTKSDFRSLAKALWKIAQNVPLDEQPRAIKWIKTGIGRREGKLPKHLITGDELKSILKLCNPRDTAIIHLLYEAGLRPHELINLKKSDVEFIKEGARINVPEGSKTGSRALLVIDSAPALANWVRNHPIRGDEPVLFPAMHGKKYKIFTIEGLNKLVKNATKRAGITRRVKTYLFRHTAATRLANILTDAQMKAYFGWEQNSDMAQVYIHTSGINTDAPLLEAHGKTVEKKELEGKLAPKVCERCKKTNLHDAEMCAYCGLSFDKDKVRKQEAEMQEKLKRFDEMEARLAKLEDMRAADFKRRLK